MERHFDTELLELKKKILEMAGLVEESIRRTVDALQQRDRKLAQRIIDDDDRIDERELEIENFAIGLLSRYQPLAGDLRFITNAMKVNAELERIADLSVDVAQRVAELAEFPLLKPLVDIPKMTVIAERMVKEAIDSFVNGDVELAKQVIRSDDEVDGLRNVIQKELVQEYIMRDPGVAPRAIPLLLVARHLERMCDHTTNIAEDVVYMVTGEVVKHHPERL